MDDIQVNDYEGKSIWAKSSVAGAYTVKATTLDDSTVVTAAAMGDSEEGGTEIEGTLNVLDGNMTAYRPQTEGPGYGNPFAKTAVPEESEEDPGAGIRVNADTEDAADEDDLIEVELEIDPYPAPDGVTYTLKRENANITIWSNREGTGDAILDSGTEATLTFSAATKTVWVENKLGGTADLELIARADGEDIESDKVHFYPFSSVVIVLSGETDEDGHLDSGMFTILSKKFYENGYDVHYYNEDVLMQDDNPDDDPPIVEIHEAQHRFAHDIAVIGFSHGAGSAYDAAPHITPTIDFMTYLDGIRQGLGNAEDRRPNDVTYLLNIYQRNDPWLIGDDVLNPDADKNCNIDEENHLTGGLEHTDMDDDDNNLEYIYNETIERIER